MSVKQREGLKMTSKYSAFLVAASAFVAITGYIFSIVSGVVILPYMDEIFHIPQAQSYCQGNFTHWDAKITTPPGLYLVSVGFNRLVRIVLPLIRDCGISVLRSTNVMLAVGNLYLFYSVTTTLNQDKNKKVASVWHCALTALTVALFPTLYFFTFLYYTDAGSTFFTLLAYLLSLKKRHSLAALDLAVAILFRQTNVVWAAFLGFLALTEVLERHAGKELKKVDMRSTGYLKVAVRSAYQLAQNKRKLGYQQLLRDIAVNCGGYILVGLGFAAFLVWNQGIVLGDRSAHRAVVHLPQLLYFSAFTLFFAAPHLLSLNRLRHCLSLTRKRWPIAILVTLLATLAVLLNTMAHPYLLADNRHYPFYVWRRILTRHPLAKFAALPVYLYALVTMFGLLRNCRGILWTVGFAVAVTINLIPQELLEFRYFILPYVVFRLSLPLSNLRLLMLEFLFYSLMNFVTIYLFVAKPFVWHDSDFLQRFMW